MSRGGGSTIHLLLRQSRLFGEGLDICPIRVILIHPKISLVLLEEDVIVVTCLDFWLECVRSSGGAFVSEAM